MLNNFIYAQTKDLFLEQLGSGNILDETIVFIEETGEIWNRGNYFGSKVDISGCATQEEVQAIVLEELAKLSKVATTGLYNDLIDKPTIPQHNTYETEALYQEAVDAGEVDENDISFVKETGKIYTQGGEYGGGAGNYVEAAILELNSDGSALTAEQKAHNVEIYNKLMRGDAIQVYLPTGPDYPLTTMFFESEFQTIITLRLPVSVSPYEIGLPLFFLHDDGSIEFNYNIIPIVSTIDTELSDTSENAVQNKTVTSEFNKIWEIIGAKDFSSDFNTDYAIY